MTTETTTKRGKKPMKGRTDARVVLTKELVDWLDEEAERTITSRSSIVRQAVQQFRQTRQAQEQAA